MDVLKCHLKDVSRERQTPLDQDLISTCYKIFPWKKNFSIRKRAVFQLPNLQIGYLNNDLKYVRK